MVDVWGLWACASENVGLLTPKREINVEHRRERGERVEKARGVTHKKRKKEKHPKSDPKNYKIEKGFNRKLTPSETWNVQGRKTAENNEHRKENPVHTPATL